MTTPPITELTTRARDVFRLVVDAYLETGQPVGSRTLSKLATLNLSPASIRNVMQDLEEFGLLASPHTSAGRLPTEQGLRLFAPQGGIGILVTVLHEAGAGVERGAGAGDQAFGVVPVGGDEVQTPHIDVLFMLRVTTLRAVCGPQ